MLCFMSYSIKCNLTESLFMSLIIVFNVALYNYYVTNKETLNLFQDRVEMLL